MKRKLLSVILTLAMCLSLLPAAALAADPETGDPPGLSDLFTGGGTEGDPY